MESILNPKSGETIKKHPKCLLKNQSSIVEIKLEDRACLELFSNYKQMGRITIRDGKKTLATGIITELINWFKNYKYIINIKNVSLKE